MKVLSALVKALRRKPSGAPTGGTGMESPPAQPMCLCGARGCPNAREHYQMFKRK